MSLDVDPRQFPEPREGWWTDEYAEATDAAMNYGQGYAAGRAAVEAEGLRYAKPMLLLWALTLVGAFALGWAVGR